uniref:Uncharacterized protein n=1 Tax=Wuchereria bancrofti TaxID=6293 RepID=A0AAF5Q4M4_WUCBA
MISVRPCERKVKCLSGRMNNPAQYLHVIILSCRSAQCCLTERTCYIFCGLPTEQAVRREARIDCDAAAAGGGDGGGGGEVENGAVRYRQDTTTTCSVGFDDSNDQQMFSSSHAYVYMYIYVFMCMYVYVCMCMYVYVIYNNNIAIAFTHIVVNNSFFTLTFARLVG